MQMALRDPNLPDIFVSFESSLLAVEDDSIATKAWSLPLRDRGQIVDDPARLCQVGFLPNAE
jgi:hypothetical protein